MPRKQTEEDGGCELDDRIPRAHPGLAVAATATKQEPAHDRNIVAATDVMTALRTSRARLYHRLAARHSPNHDVEERPDEQPEETGQQGKHAENLSQH